MLFMWIPVPGTITPEPEPADAESEAALPRSSIAEMCVVLDTARTRASARLTLSFASRLEASPPR
jgi:hypothetical protein